jgi:acetate---CoA ligase (ADP-forming)
MESNHLTAADRSQPKLKRLFAPSSVALVGATDDLAKFGGRCLDRMIRFGYQGKIYPINPKYQEIRGLPCYPSLREVPGRIDHVGIVVPARGVFDVLRQCEERDIPFATIFTSGFAEAGTPAGRELQAQITDFARRTGIRIVGPNCNGLINFVDGFAMTSTGTLDGPRRPAGRIGIVSHSGGLGQVNVMWRAQQAGLNISYEVSCGNDADLDALDFIRFMVEDTASDVILVVAERFSSGTKLAEVARLAREREKPIVILKLGRTEAGSRAAASHTGSITGSDVVYDAAFRQYGLIRVEDFNELYEVGMLLQTRRWPKNDGVAAISISGGNIALVADLGSSLGLNYPEFTAATQARLAEALPDYGKVGNPADLTSGGTGSKTLFQDALSALAADDRVGVMVPILTMTSPRFVEDVKTVAVQTDKPVALLWTGGCTDHSVGSSTLTELGIPVYQNTLSCLKAVRSTIGFANFLRRTEVEPDSAPPMLPPGQVDLLRGQLRAASGALTERASKEILGAYGFPVTREALAATPEVAVRLAQQIGYPVALKIESPDISHKTEAGAIRLGLDSEDAVRRAFDEVHHAASRYKPSARLDGVLVQEMVPPGLEVILGLTNDPTFGPVVAVGLGGIHVELFRDVAYRIPPVGHVEALRMLRELRAYRLLEGMRGASPRDIEVLAELITRLSQLALDLAGDLAELDINPLVLLERGAGARVVDALLIPTGQSGTTAR